MDIHTARQVLEFLHLAGRLKQTTRAGWVLRGIAQPESVAEHTYRVALLALVLGGKGEPGLDRERCVAMALVHDLGESIVGDITPYDGVAPEEKRRREREAMARLAELAGDPGVLALWEEYDAGATPEARWVKELDKLETVVQAAEYQAEHAVDLGEFRALGERLSSPAARALLAALDEGKARP